MAVTLPLSPTPRTAPDSKKSTLFATIDEYLFGMPSEYSSAGLQRKENERARLHATAERLGSEKFNAEQAEINRQWQERLANTSYQRAMEDMRQAGINPMFAIGQGGAITPSGGTAYSSSNPSGANLTRDNAEPFLKLLGLAIQGLNTASLVSARKDEKLLNIAKAGLTNANTGLTKANTDLAIANKDLIKANTGLSLQKASESVANEMVLHAKKQALNLDNLHYFDNHNWKLKLNKGKLENYQSMNDLNLERIKDLRFRRLGNQFKEYKD